MEISSSGDTADALRAILREAKALAVRYFALTGKPLGVTGEVAELEAADKLNLVLTVARNPDYDAVRNDESRVVERFQIKGRAVDPIDRYRGRMPSVKCDGDFDWVLLVLLNRSTFDALEIWQASRHDVAKRLQAPGSKARNERLSMGITQFKSIAYKAWSDETMDQNRRSRVPNSLGTRSVTPEIGAVNKDMRREEAIRRVSQRCKVAALDGSNTHFVFANINKTRRDIWWLNISLERVEGPRSKDIINLLLYNNLANKIHHLRVPTSYLRENLWKLKRLREQIDLYLSVDNFQDDSKCRFQHLVCGCSG